MASASILVVDDETAIADLVEVYLSNEGFTVHKFHNAADALACVEREDLDLAILDVMLPDMDGYSILVRIRENDEKLPVIVVSAKSDELSLVKGLNKGADDYIVKPFSILELRARIKTALRRVTTAVKKISGFEIDGNTYTVRYDGKELGLTLKEFNLFRTLAAKAGVTLTRESLLGDVWGMDYEGETRTLDMHVASLRDKIHKAGGGDCIVTVRGVGYRFEQ